MYLVKPWQAALASKCIRGSTKGAPWYQYVCMYMFLSYIECSHSVRDNALFKYIHCILLEF